MIPSFLKVIADSLAAAGFEVSVDGHTLIVAGCKVQAYAAPSAWRVRFLNSSYTVRPGGKFNIKKAVQAVVAALPNLLQLKERDEQRGRMRGLAAFVAGPNNKTLPLPLYSQYLEARPGMVVGLTHDNKLKLVLDIDDPSTAMILMDFIEDWKYQR